ncbi:MAG: hypothetical protein JWO69_372 [Thermoleophilia bacterium]|jgi:hypothetical protein|nr:hypothetical protein [Thermoleophilia bacterium]
MTSTRILFWFVLCFVILVAGGYIALAVAGR